MTDLSALATSIADGVRELAEENTRLRSMLIDLQAELDKADTENARLRVIIDRAGDVEGICNAIKDHWGVPSWKIAELVAAYVKEG